MKLFNILLKRYPFAFRVSQFNESGMPKKKQNNLDQTREVIRDLLFSCLIKRILVISVIFMIFISL